MMDSTLTEKISSSVEIVKSKLSPIIGQVVFLLKMSVMLSAAALLVASAWF